MRYVKLPEIAEMGSGGTPSRKKKEYYKNGSVPWLKSGELNNGIVTSAEEYITEKAIKESSAKIAPKGSLLVAMYGATAGKVGLLDFESSMNQAVCFIKPDIEEADVRYLYYYLMSKNQELLDKREGGGQPNISQTILKSLKIPLPSLSEQKAIVAKLDRAQRLIDIDREMLAKYDELIQSVFLEMFGDPVRNEKGWEEVKMEEIVTILRGGSPRPIKKYLGGEIPWIKISDGTKGDDLYIDSTEECIIEDGLKKTRLLEKGSLILANSGVSLGFARILKIRGCIHDGWLSISDLDESVIKPIFLLKQINQLTDHFRRTAPDGTQPNLNTGIVKKLKVLVPPADLQDNFIEIVLKVRKETDHLKDSSKKSEELFSSLVQGVFGS